MIIRTIRGVRYRCYDIGVDDLKRAKWNRWIIEHKFYTIAYELVEAYLASPNIKSQLPKWIPVGDLTKY